MSERNNDFNEKKNVASSETATPSTSTKVPVPQSNDNDNDKQQQNNHDHKKRPKRKNDKETSLSKALSKVLRHDAVNLGLAISSDGYVAVQDILSHGMNPSRRKGKQKGGRGGRGRGGSGRFSQYTLEDIQNVVTNNEKQRFRLTMRIHPAISNKMNIQTNEINILNKEENQTQEEMVLCIRANQGHTMTCINENELLTSIPMENLALMNGTECDTTGNAIVHGTYRKAWVEYIQKEGLCRMKRNHIHFAPGLPTGFVLGRHSLNDNNTSSDINMMDDKEIINSDDRESATAKPKPTIQVISGMRNSCDVLIFLNGRKCAEDGISFFRSDNGVILTSGLGERGMLPPKYFLKVLDVKTNDVLFHQEDNGGVQHE